MGVSTGSAFFAQVKQVKQVKQVNRAEARDQQLAFKLKRLEPKIQDERGKIESGGPKKQDRALEI